MRKSQLVFLEIILLLLAYISFISYNYIGVVVFIAEYVSIIKKRKEAARKWLYGIYFQIVIVSMAIFLYTFILVGLIKFNNDYNNENEYNYDDTRKSDNSTTSNSYVDFVFSDDDDYEMFTSISRSQISSKLISEIFALIILIYVVRNIRKFIREYFPYQDTEYQYTNTTGEPERNEMAMVSTYPYGPSDNQNYRFLQCSNYPPNEGNCNQNIYQSTDDTLPKYTPYTSPQYQVPYPYPPIIDEKKQHQNTIYNPEVSSSYSQNPNNMQPQQLQSQQLQSQQLQSQQLQSQQLQSQQLQSQQLQSQQLQSQQLQSQQLQSQQLQSQQLQSQQLQSQQLQSQQLQSQQLQSQQLQSQQLQSQQLQSQQLQPQQLQPQQLQPQPQQLQPQQLQPQPQQLQPQQLQPQQLQPQPQQQQYSFGNNELNDSLPPPPPYEP